MKEQINRHPRRSHIIPYHTQSPTCLPILSVYPSAIAPPHKKQQVPSNNTSKSRQRMHRM
ncbi:hypothetical protein B0T17DRAFT_535338 [Bombardia bombarda]|uniref:Uncharacterized protein n=1 Tax=Bombardia bombarda TaxID=252184 RepID=A0AA39WUQ1_9PEZI|nr:hypothetical protein B0T17DRAFT_535338 [Bombardia bombarda]